jgi:hypothetical protein
MDLNSVATGIIIAESAQRLYLDLANRDIKHQEKLFTGSSGSVLVRVSPPSFGWIPSKDAGCPPPNNSAIRRNILDGKLSAYTFRH